MAQLQNLILKDESGAASTFVPRDIRQGVGTVVNTTGVPIGESRFSISLRQTANGRYKCTIKFAEPVVSEATVNGVSRPEVQHIMNASLEFDFARNSTTEERAAFVARLASSLDKDQALVYGSTVNLEGVY